MDRFTAVRQALVKNDGLGFALVHSVNQLRYLNALSHLLVEYQCVNCVTKRQIFVKMIHTFMQELCGYHTNSYIVTTNVYGNVEIGSKPHVIPAAYSANSTLFYFTASQSPDDVQDLWVKHAQVYLAAPQKGDTIAEDATKVVFTNFFILDGASKDHNTDAWHLWSASDVAEAQVARVDLRNLADDRQLTSQMSQAIQHRLQTIRYQMSPDARNPNTRTLEARAQLGRLPRMEGHNS